ncbi:hypothetical protein FB45DRAFT_919042 [Roridomyces roridus]|uniref:Uncharacterized protein n=1 Tax=Roridomyces roridus TaxID=1738132 RepID=A0AAD7FJY1_9AGAR|nr:hypothetical protein FB45DRAFT_919042 [Roridomyces roridus]
MDGLLPLAVLTLLVAISISGPVFAAFRLVRRVVQPAPRPDTPPQDSIVKPDPPLYALVLRALLSIIVPTRVEPSTSPGLSALRNQLNPSSSDSKTSSPAHSENTLVGTDTPTPEPEQPSPNAPTNANGPSLPLPTGLQRPHKGQTQRPQPYVDFTIGWDDIWPARPSPRMTYTYNSYFNAFTASRATDPPPPPQPAPPSEECGDSSFSSDDDDVDDEMDLDFVLELASQSEDDDLIWALQSLTLSDSPPSSLSAELRLPAAGQSPFCPPPPPVPSPSPSQAAWRLEWY